MKTLLLTLMTCLVAQAAPAIPGGLRVNYDTTGTNTIGTAVTVQARTNLLAGTVVSTNRIVIGPNAATLWGTDMADIGLLSLQQIGSDYDTNIFLHGAADAAWDNYAYIEAKANSGGTSMSVLTEGFDITTGYGAFWISTTPTATFTRHTWENDTSTDIRQFEVNLSSAGGELRLIRNATNFVRLSPHLTDGLGTPAFLFMPETDWASGSLFEIANPVGGTLFSVAGNSGYTGAGTLFLSDDGTYQAAGGGTTINPTDGYLPYRFDATTFADSPWNHIDTNRMGFYTTNVFLYSNEDDVALSMGLNGQQAGLFANTSFGHNAFENLTTGIENNAFGFHALWSITEGSQNSAFGTSSLLLITDSSDNATLGNGTLVNLLTGDGNVAIGVSAGQELQLGSNNTIVGNRAQSDNTLTYTNLSNTIVIGASARATNDNEIIIGNGTNTTAILNIASFSGTGTKALFDDGTYKTLAGGSTVRSLKLQYPRRIDGTGCTYSNTNDFTAQLFMVPRFSGSAATNENYAEWAFRVPADLDTNVTMTASLTVQLAGADTDDAVYTLGVVSIANSSPGAGTPANYTNFTIPGDGSGADGDIESVNNVPLIEWIGALTANEWALVRLQRDGDDASAVAQDALELEIFYTSTQ